MIRPAIINTLLLPCAIVLAQTFSAGCTESSFTGGSAAMKKKPGSGRTTKPTVGTTIDLPKGSLLSDQRKVEASKTQKIWTVNTNGKATLFTIDGDNVTTKSWTGITGSGGTRTYVTEGGFVAARFPNIYFIDPETTPQGPIPAANTKNIGATDRICLASYVKNNKRYLFAAYGNGSYWDIPLSEEKPYRPLWDQKTASTLPGAGQWGYSCYIDQVKNIFYSQFGRSGNITAINLNTLTAHIGGAPNKAFFSTNFPNLTQSTKSVLERVGIISYSIAGDSEGNVFNGNGIYTMAYDSDSDSVWASDFTSGDVQIFPRACLVNQAVCTGMSPVSRAPTDIGPMSALRDGRVAAVTRTTGEVYILSLKDKANVAAGFDAKKIGNAGGDPYMYTDFTGATLYIREAAQAFDMSKQAGYKSGAPNASTVFTWKSKSGVNKPWKDIKLEVRCFDDESKKPGYEEVKTVGNADKYTDVTVASCAGKVAKFVEVQVTQQNNSTSLADIEFLQIAIKQ